MFTQQLTIDSIEALLPEGYTARGATMDDLEATVAVFNACARALNSGEEFNAIDFRSEWEVPNLDLSHDLRLVISPAGQIVGYMEFWDLSEPHIRYRAWGRVHPDHLNRGLGTYLVRWAEQRAQQAIPRALQESRIWMTSWVNDLNLRAKLLFENCGWHVIRKNYRMAIELTAPPADPIWPDGITLRTFVPGQDERATVQADRDAFRDHWGYVERPLEAEIKMLKHHMSKPGFDPTLWLLGMDGHRVAGKCLNDPQAEDDPDMGWITDLGVRREYRRRGLGQALLQYSFADFYRRGKRKVGLNVDASSLTGALRLYEHAGMHVVRVNSTYEKELRAGVDLSTQSIS
ncbi:MAG TPA: GNAT family N-acetyltransferase [Anaerolineae bacterium]|nr:GNAT family N-acetyltransferase [Anaerolineae bacterium]